MMSWCTECLKFLCVAFVILSLSVFLLFLLIYFSSFLIVVKDPLLTMILCAPIEKQDNGDLGQKGLSDNTIVALGATKDHG